MIEFLTSGSSPAFGKFEKGERRSMPPELEEKLVNAGVAKFTESEKEVDDAEVNKKPPVRKRAFNEEK